MVFEASTMATMCTSWASCAVLLYLVLFLTPCCPILVTALPALSYLTPNASTSWTNSLSAPDSVKFDDGSFARIILAREFNHYFKTGCGCGFFYNQTRNTHVFAIFTLSYDDVNAVNISKSKDPKVVWFANPENPVSINATLQLTSEKGLVLKDAKGTTVWSTNILSKSVAGLNLTEMCNLQLLDDKSATVWQSFDHPTDTLVVGQKLVAGQQLTSQGGLFSLHVTRQGIFAYVSSNPPQRYFTYTSDNTSHIQFLEDRMTFSSNTNTDFPLPSSNFFPNRYMTLGADNGRLKVYDILWGEVFDFFDRLKVLPCLFPTVCGNYGICSNGQCSCPRPINATGYFQATKETQPDHGCSLITPLSCEVSKNHILLELKEITYFPFTQDPPGINPAHQHINLDSCKQACLKDCSCKAAFYNSSKSLGNCYLLSQIYSLMAVDQDNTDFKVYIKVQNPIQQQTNQQTNHRKKKQVIMGSSLGSLLVIFLLIGIFALLFWKKENADEAEEYYLDHVPGMPTRYSYDDLQAITENFNKELGRGGFGTVFEGTLLDGTKVAVKCLDSFSQIKKSFLAEVETIGSIHHINLVRLIGFCAEKYHRLLVYEYMSNGSLDRWVFHKNPEMLLDWKLRKKIIIEIARGLSYLHEDCRQKIVHLDIKPHNILLDENFNAKVSDFGLSKLVDHDQSQVVTNMRGTPGYMAPEWLSSMITEKVDVYSFGVVLLEILCGRRNFDHSQPEEAMHLLDLFKKNIVEDRLLDLVDKCSEDMQLHGAEVVNMMRVAIWCLQNDFTRRPSMSMVVKVLEGAVNVESDLDYFFSNPSLLNMRGGVENQEVHIVAATPLLPSVLSGPR
ncbi:G-type lectin S-receptor-like serine/threonine-protein kinase SD2-5 isoform X2 [Quercus robur]|uniref:G-type lectin S-receptor-like serine/threonine-protein kinase SD2-5 isoform X2 n=1 Tax=Quercus robur TaxID=38942 RepID=UPI002163829F|nr:G-type lectin S-receptor-like serine/threonine-protein kinase SD2-5 isoform X2 [Quercus robur]